MSDIIDLSFIPVGYVPYVVGGLVVLLGLKVLSAIVAPAKEDPGIYVMKRCSCGWTGRVSKHAPVCRKCASPIDL